MLWQKKESEELAVWEEDKVSGTAALGSGAAGMGSSEWERIEKRKLSHKLLI